MCTLKSIATDIKKTENSRFFLCFISAKCTWSNEIPTKANSLYHSIGYFESNGLLMLHKSEATHSLKICLVCFSPYCSSNQNVCAPRLLSLPTMFGFCILSILFLTIFSSLADFCAKCELRKKRLQLNEEEMWNTLFIHESTIN